MFKQGLFWSIIDQDSSIVSQNLDFLQKFFEDTYLEEKYNNPENLESFIVFTGTTVIDFTSIEKILTREVISYLNKTGLKIYLYEPLSLYSLKHNEQYNKGHYSEFHNSDRYSDIRAGELDSISEFVQKHCLENVEVKTCDYNVEQIVGPSYPTISLCCEDIFVATIKMLPSINRSATEINKKFWCANGRYTLSRHAVMSYLADKPGIYSWQYTCKKNCVDLPDSWIDRTLLTNKTLETLDNGNYLLNSSYFYIDTTYEREDIVYHGCCRTGPALRKALMKNYWHTRFINSRKYAFAAIVNESRYAQPTGNISEKVLNVTSTRCPFVLAAPPYTLEYLKRLGFKTFAEFWDESYDLEEDPSKRLIKIFEVIDHINSMSIDELRKMYKEMDSILTHNEVICNRICNSLRIAPKDDK